MPGETSKLKFYFKIIIFFIVGYLMVYASVNLESLGQAEKDVSSIIGIPLVFFSMLFVLAGTSKMAKA